MLSPEHTTRWREHEFLLVTLLCTIAVAGNCWRLFQHSAATLADIYGWSFTNSGLPFDYTRNILLPNIAVPVILYVSYIWMNLFILPSLLQAEATAIGSFRLQFTTNANARIEMGGPGSQSLRRLIRGLGLTFLLILGLGTGWGIAHFYRYRPNMPRDISNIMIMGTGLRMAINLTVAYIIYAIIRETILKKLEKNADTHTGRIHLLNQCTALITCYFTLGMLLYYFGMLEGPATVWYFIILPSFTLAGLINIYWIFPRKPEAKPTDRTLFWRILLNSFIWSLPFAIAVPDGHDVMPALLALWAAQMLITTPISRYVFKQQKQRILQIKGLETQLGQSKADLQFLRSQINPHFLFNVLNTLYGTALHENASRTAGGIQQLGDMMRFMLHENNLDRIAMSKEIEYVKNYIALQQLRTETSQNITIETHIDEDFPECSIAPMLLIPFVENAFKHGISLREPSWIKIDLHCDLGPNPPYGQNPIPNPPPGQDPVLTPAPDQKTAIPGQNAATAGAPPHPCCNIRLEVRNSVHIRHTDDPEKGRSGVGMKNVLHRLKLIYPGHHEFFMHQDEKEFFVQLALQL